MKILYFGAYDNLYSRNRILIKGLRNIGVEVVECRDRSRSVFKYVRLFFKYLRSPKDFDMMIVGFPGQEIMFLARLLTRKPIIFDAFTSHYGGHILDRGTYGKTSLRARYYRWIDTYSCRLANVVLLDTQAHIDFFVKEFNLSSDKFKRIFVGADSDVFYRRPNTDHEDFVVHFHGNYIPLQGVRYILEAAKLLEHQPVRFNIIGRGQTYARDMDLAEKLALRNVKFYDRVSYEDLADFMAQADVCLGIFGNTPKTDLVIPNKVFEALASGRAVITADTPAIRELLKDKEHVILCRKADPSDLAQAITLLMNSLSLRESIALAGEGLFKDSLTEVHLAQELIDYINERKLLSK